MKQSYLSLKNVAKSSKAAHKMSIKYVSHGFLVSTIYIFNLAYVISHLVSPASTFFTYLLSLLSLKCLLCFLSHKIELRDSKQVMMHYIFVLSEW